MSTTISGTTGVDKATNQAVKDAMGVTGTAPIFGCRAWVNFDGTRNESDTGASVIGQNVKIRGSGNVSSVLKNAVGDYTVNFTTAMLDANYSEIVGSGVTTSAIFGAARAFCTGNRLSTAITVIIADNGGDTQFDMGVVNVSIFR